MDRRERINSLQEAMIAILDGLQARLWTALPAIVQSFDAEKITCKAQPAIQAQFQQQDGSWLWVKMPLLLDVPVVFPGAGGYTLTFPVAEGDEALIIFSSRCIDAWWASGGIQVQAELRMHDLSDGFAIVGLRSQPRKFTVSTTAMQLRSDDGEAKIEFSAGHVINIETTGGVNITAAGLLKLQGTGPAIARVGDTTTCPAGAGTITSGSGTATCG